jgi:RHS repeat-associated protein
MGSICPSDANTYLQTLETDTWGHVVKERRGNSAAMDVARTYKADTGRIWSICAGDIACNLVNEGYGWDANGNLHTHQKESRYLEQFTYDDLNRLTEGRLVMEDGVTVDRISQAFVYDPLGNICRKSEWGNDYDYVYGGRTGCGLGALPGDGADVYTGPTRLVQIGVTHFAYDDRGNQTSKFRLDTPGTSKDRFVRYSLDDKGYEIALGNLASPVQRTRFWYGPDGQRYKREDGNRLTRYVGNVEVITENGVTTYKRYIAGVMVQEVVGSTAINRYMFHDQLGSIVKITDANGTAIQTRDFDAFGERRDPSNATALGATPSPNITTRGFTGHEHTDGVYPTYVVHMNGRLYSSSEGRFLQADPFIQAPYNAQSWNAYSYVFNNPLRYTDPTGMLGVEERQWLAAIVMIVSIFFAPEYTPEAAGAFVGYFAVAGFVSGAIATQSWKGGLMGAMTGAVTAGIGGLAGQGAFTFTDWTVLTFTGGVMGSLQGGEFGNSFLSAGLSAAFMPQLGRIGNDVGRTLAGAIVGGTISELTGGKFANGAVSGAVQAAMAGVPADTAEEADCKGGIGKPVGDRFQLDRINPDWRDNLSVVQEGDAFVIRGNLTVSGSGAEFAARDVTAAWGNASGEYQGVMYRSEITLSAVKSGGDWQIKPMRQLQWERLNAKLCSGIVGAQVDAIGGSILNTPPIRSVWQQAGIPAHEFGHALGLSHATPGSGSIMSYDPGRAVVGHDLFNLAGGYR